MNQEQSLVPQILVQRGNRTAENIISVVVGVAFLSLLAQLAFPLPFTPVLITGQTFGVALIALLWGRKRGVAVVASYLAVGALGFPVFAAARSGLVIGPTMGYLFGMLLASYWMGMLSDWGWTKSFFKSWLAVFTGSVIVFSFGTLVLSFFVPAKDVFMLGVLPFLPGDFVKSLAASYIAFKANKLN